MFTARCAVIKADILRETNIFRKCAEYSGSNLRKPTGQFLRAQHKTVAKLV